jgi:hypothetical protein
MRISKRAIWLMLTLFLAVFPVLSINTAAQAYPHAVFGTVTSDDGSPVAGASVEVENQRTSQTLTDTTDSLGRFQVDLISMPSGYQDGDSIRVTAQLDDLQASKVVTVSGPNNECNLSLSLDGDGQITGIGVEGVVCVVFSMALLVTRLRRRRR